MSLPVIHIDHCSVIVTDAARAREFYGGRLGLREIAPPRTFDFDVVWYDLGGTYLHLLVKPRPDTVSPRHFCLRVTDIVAARRVAEAGGIHVEETVKIPGAERFFIRDPDSNRIEILQWERPYDPERDGAFRV